MRRVLFVSSFILVFLGIAFNRPTPSLAQEKSVVVERRDAQITILPSGDVKIIETWVVRFIGGSFTKAYRSIPFNKVASIDAWTVEEDGQPYIRADGGSAGTYSVTAEGGNIVANWFFPPTRDETRTFVLGYTLHGALRIDPAGDQFYWIFIESSREYTIQQARVSLRLPAEVAPEQLQLAAYLDRKEQPGASIQDRQTILYQGGPFDGGQVWEIRVQFPHGLVTASPPAWQANEITLARVTAVNILGVALAVLGVAGGIYLLLRYRKHAQVDIVEYVNSPPAPLPPAMAGALVKGYVHGMHLVATLVDLARRGHLRISVSGKIFTMTRLNPDRPSLLPFEGQLLSTLFAGREELMKMDWETRLSAAAGGFRHGVNRELARQGFRMRIHPTLILLPAALLLFLPIPVLMLSLSGGEALLGMLSGVFVGLILFLISFNLTNTTPAGREASARWVKFSEYLTSKEGNAGEAPDPADFDAWLPYAVAFNCERIWAEAFEDQKEIDIGWLPGGMGVFTLYALVDKLAEAARGLLRPPALESGSSWGGESSGWSSDGGGDGDGGGGGGGDGGGGGSSGFG